MNFDLTKEDIILLKCAFDYEFNCITCLIKNKCKENGYINIKIDLLKKIGIV